MSPAEASAQSSRVCVTISMMVATPRPSSPMAQACAPANSTSEEAFERLPSLSFRRWKCRPFTLPSGRKRGIRKQVSPPAACASTRKASRHGRGHEPLVAGDDVFGARPRLPTGSAVVVAARTSVPPCFSVMPMPIVTALFFAAGAKLGSYLKGRMRGTHSLASVGLEQQHRHGGVGHGNRAAVPGLHLRRHVEGTRARARGARPGRFPGLCEVGPDRAVQALAAARTHQLVVGRVICDRVAAMAAGVVGRKPRGMLIGKPAAPERLCAARQAPEGLQPLRRVAAALPLDSLLERRVGGKEVHVLQWWRLVEDLMRCKRGRHALPFNAFWQT